MIHLYIKSPMCGISLILSLIPDTNIIKELIDSLEQLQNRGYDSVGIGYFDVSNNISNTITTMKYASTSSTDCFNDLKYYYENSFLIRKSGCAIGHTRWATHGPRNTVNAHPHSSFNNKFTLVHNGIIENFLELREFLREKNITCISETDSEVIVNLIAYYYENTDNYEMAIIQACNKLQGTYALGILCQDATNTIYTIRNGSPLIFGQNNETMICTSEISGFNNQVTNYIKLENKILYKMQKNAFDSKYSNIEIISHINGEKVDSQELMQIFNISKLDQDLNTLSCYPYVNFTLKEINEQPESIMRAFNYGGRIAENCVKLGGLQKLVENHPNRLEINHIILLGCGTSLHACMIGSNYLLHNCEFDSVNYYDASEFSKKNIPRHGKTLVILCSQSGETRDLYENLEICQKSNCLTLGVINVVDSLIAQSVDFGVYLNAGREVGVASTKSFTSMVIVISLISLFFSSYFNKITSAKRENIIDNLRNLSNSINNILKNDDLLGKVQTINEKIQRNNSIFILGKGKYFAVAREISLKIKELCYIHAEGFSGSALKHGPFALLDKNSVVFLIITSDTESTMLNCYQEISAREANIIIFTNNKEIYAQLMAINRPRDDIIYIETGKYYTEIGFSVILQYLTYDLSIKKGINPDKPRNLAKVVTVQ